MAVSATKFTPSQPSKVSLSHDSRSLTSVRARARVSIVFVRRLTISGDFIRWCSDLMRISEMSLNNVLLIQPVVLRLLSVQMFARSVDVMMLVRC